VYYIVVIDLKSVATIFALKLFTNVYNRYKDGEPYMNIKNILTMSILTLTLTSFTTGCEYVTGTITDDSILRYFKSGDTEQLFETAGTQKSAEENLASYGITIPTSDTSIYVNRLGYSVNGTKKAIFSGDRIGDKFDVVNADNGHVVFTGKITGDSVKTGDFSLVTTKGRFYIETSGVGRSYYFTISDNAELDLFTDMLNNFYSEDDVIEADKANIIDACLGMNAVIYAMQCNGEAFDIDNNIVEELLHMSDDLVSLQEKDGSLLEDYESTAAFCGIISMCANEFGKYEDSMDKTYKEAADKAWKWLEKQQLENDSEDIKQYNAAQFYAASQLFDLLGGKDYQDISEAYLTELKKADYVYDNFSFYGIISYMSSTDTVDKELCTSIMMKMLNEVDDIANKASADKVYRVGTTDINEVMTNTAQICLFNYLVPSREYTDLLSNTIEYIGGYNQSGTNYMENGAKEKYFEYKGIMLFALSNIVTED
jgi:hypothetical protein